MLNFSHCKNAVSNSGFVLQTNSDCDLLIVLIIHRSNLLSKFRLFFYFKEAKNSNSKNCMNRT